MKRILISTALIFVSLSAAPAQVQKTREVILAARRNQQLVVFDARSLAELGHFVVNESVNGVSVSQDGRTLFVEQPRLSEPGNCCALFSLDLATDSLCQLIFPSSRAVASPDGRLLFTQRGAVGVEVFDAKSFVRLPVIKAPGNYAMHISPDGRWIFGITYWKGPSLDVFDVGRRGLVRRLALPEGSPQGAWLGDQFYVYAHDGIQGNLWPVAPDTTALTAPRKIDLPVRGVDGKPVSQVMIAAGDRLIVYEPRGWWLKMARDEDAEVSHGLFSIDPATGAFEHMAPTTDFTQVVASTDGGNLYGVDAGTRDGTRPVTLTRIKTRSGSVLKKRDLPRDVWSISYARIPEELIPHGTVVPTPCTNANAGVNK